MQANDPDMPREDVEGILRSIKKPDISEKKIRQAMSAWDRPRGLLGEAGPIARTIGGLQRGAEEALLTGTGMGPGSTPEPRGTAGAAGRLVGQLAMFGKMAGPVGAGAPAVDLGVARVVSKIGLKGAKARLAEAALKTGAAGAGFTGGAEAIQEVATGEPLQPRRIASATAQGFVVGAGLGAGLGAAGEVMGGISGRQTRGAIEAPVSRVAYPGGRRSIIPMPPPSPLEGAPMYEVQRGISARQVFQDQMALNARREQVMKARAPTEYIPYEGQEFPRPGPLPEKVAGRKPPFISSQEARFRQGVRIKKTPSLVPIEPTTSLPPEQLLSLAPGEPQYFGKLTPETRPEFERIAAEKEANPDQWKAVVDAVKQDTTLSEPAKVERLAILDPQPSGVTGKIITPEEAVTTAIAKETSKVEKPVGKGEPPGPRAAPESGMARNLEGGQWISNEEFNALPVGEKSNYFYSSETGQWMPIATKTLAAESPVPPEIPPTAAQGEGFVPGTTEAAKSGRMGEGAAPPGEQRAGPYVPGVSPEPGEIKPTAPLPEHLSRFAKNTVYTPDKVAAAQELLKRPKMYGGGPSLEELNAYVTIGGAYIESGLRDFAAWSVQMLQDAKETGHNIKKELPKIWRSARLQALPNEPASILVSALDKAESKLPQRREMVGVLRRKQAAALGSALEKGTGEEAFVKGSAALRGIAESPEFTPLRQLIEPGKTNALFDEIRTTPAYNKNAVFSKKHAGDGLWHLLDGHFPPPNEMEALHDVFGPDFLMAAERLKQHPLGEKIWREIVEAANLPRALQTMLDLSFGLRQGAVLGYRHPGLWFDAFKTQLGVVFSERNMGTLMDSIRAHPAYDAARSAKLYLAPWGEQTLGSTAREEALLSKWVERIPGLKQSARAYIAMGNKLRFDVFVKQWEALGGENAALEDLRGIANVINHATGRGSLGRLEAVAPELATILYSPRYKLSRVQMIADMFRGPAVAKRMARENFAAWMGANLALLALLKVSGAADVELNPLSTDFGKARIGKTRFDLWAGLQPIIRYMTQAAYGTSKDVETGYIAPPRASFRGATVARFGRSMLAPTPSIIWDLLSGRNYEGQPLHLDEETIVREGLRNIEPMDLADAIDAFRESNVGVASLATAASALGTGVTTYTPRQRVRGQRRVRMSP